MKKLFLFFLFLISFLSVSFPVSAASESESEESDSDILNSGFFEVADPTKENSPVSRLEFSVSELSVVHDARLFIGYKRFDDNGEDRFYICGTEGANISVVSSYGFNGSFMPTGVYTVHPYMDGNLVFYRLYPISAWGYTYSTNLPIFNLDTDSEAINTYVVTGDYSGAVNADEVNKDNVEQDDSIELPKNLRTYGDSRNLFSSSSVLNKNARVTVRWDVPQEHIDNYSYDVQIRFCQVKGTDFIWTSWGTEVSAFPYSGRTFYDLDTGKEIPRSVDTPEDFYVTLDLMQKYIPAGDNLAGLEHVAFSDFEVRVRNRSGNKCSAWVSTKVNISGSQSVVATDDDGNVIDNDEYNGQDNNNSDHKDYYDSDHGNDDNSVDSGGNLDFSGIFSYIKSGFGLLGSGGLLSLMSSTFSYVPSSVWTLIKTAIAISITIMVLSLVKRFVLG